VELPQYEVEKDTCEDERYEEADPFDEYCAEQINNFHEKGLEGNLALVETVRFAIQTIDTFASRIDARYRID